MLMSESQICADYLISQITLQWNRAMSTEEYLYKDLTGKVIGCFVQDHSFLGKGFQEEIYPRAFALVLMKAGLEFQREIEQETFYKDFEEPIGTRRADFIITGKVIVGLIAISELHVADRAQVLNYLKAYKFSSWFIGRPTIKCLHY